MAASLTAPSLEAVAAGWAVRLSNGQRERLDAFVTLLLRWNERINLTGARTREELLGEHLPDAFAVARLVPEGARVVDVGAGGGLPGVPLAVLRPDAPVVLLEPRAKRSAFLRTAVRELGLDAAQVLAVRDEELADAGSFDAAVSRATFPPDEWLRRGLALVKPGGRVIVLAAEPVAATTGRLVDEVKYTTRDGRPRWAGALCST